MSAIQPPATFSAKAQAEIDRNAFAAKTGGLVNLSAPTFWELYEAAKAWQELQNPPMPVFPPPVLRLEDFRGGKLSLKALRMRYRDMRRDRELRPGEVPVAIVDTVGEVLEKLEGRGLIFCENYGSRKPALDTEIGSIENWRVALAPPNYQQSATAT